MSKRFVLLAVIAALSLFAFANVEKSQAHAGGKFERASTVAFGGVTNIKEVVNKTSGVLRVSKVDSPINIFHSGISSTWDIPADGVWSGDMWIPWANNAEEFKGHKMTLSIGLHPNPGNQNLVYTNFYLWQSGEFVRFAITDKFIENAPKVPGEARAGGERRLVVTAEGTKAIFTFEKYTE